MTEEMALLRDYAATRSQQAFARLSERYVDLVYTAARRQLHGDAHLAEDVTQAVFIVLAQKAKSVPPDRPLSGWLLKVTGYCAANARRRRGRQELHERRAAEMARTTSHEVQSGSEEAGWEALSPLLDQGMAKLPAADRDALLLRFFEKKSLRQVGEAMGISEEAAQKRVVRAVDKLRGFFRARGATVSAGALLGLLTTETIKAAPAGLAGAVGTASGAAGGSTAAAAAAKGAMVAMAMHKTAALAAAGLVLLLGIGGGAMVVHSLGTRGTTRTITLPATPAAQAGTPASSASAPVTFADGTTVRILGISEVPRGGGVRNWIGTVLGGGTAPAATQQQSTGWWGADGSPLPTPTLQDLGNVSAGDAPGRRQVRLLFSMRGPSVGAGGLTVRVDGVNSNAYSSRASNNETIVNYCGSLPNGLDRAAIRLGLSKGPWREDASMTLATTTQPTTRASGPAMFKKIAEQNGDCVVDITFPQNRGEDRDAYFALITKSGKQVMPQEWRSSAGGRGVVRFPCRRSDVAKLVWMTRPYEWATMGEVSLKPAQSPTTRVASGK
jgi:RNA polymerase sigma factor (sigma-70 family)